MSTADARFTENIAAISSNLTLARYQDGQTFFDMHSDGLEGWIGTLQWFIHAAGVFTEIESGIPVSEPFDWYDAIDGYTDRIIANGAELPNDTDLKNFASAAVSNARGQDSEGR